MNKFTLVNRADATVQRDIDGWSDKIKSYVRELFENDIERPLGTEFGDCIVKVIYISDRAVAEPEIFRGVRDELGRLQAGAIVEPYFDYLDVDALTNAPWNVLKNQPETLKGAATSLMEELIKESFELGFSGRIRLYPLQRAKQFYADIGFVESDEGDWELTEDAALRFLEEQRLFWETGRRSR
ncbi:hypothetical protein C7Y66_14550 [Chroococcidiopsis sp. CCALA 051]|jgi:hypothetical protein|uniref:hypothetical protein n=1 Tax=Chroococcidiopsis sp. CCALA 051 TaxID=869949 RepID=UPI000D0DF25F|nr:hypothetical protein [Chroococcidiopsis sp. CCALA 051]MBE9018605.1 hypothetical protein [Chroococcidiopsidales cyanobacterium LEGE 13417]PSM48438.1 hypothetical protein C7Y66_14550 [Chroococcidiopsis sp. CCALA 051]